MSYVSIIQPLFPPRCLHNIWTAPQEQDRKLVTLHYFCMFCFFPPVLGHFLTFLGHFLIFLFLFLNFFSLLNLRNKSRGPPGQAIKKINTVLEKINDFQALKKFSHALTFETEKKNICEWFCVFQIHPNHICTLKTVPLI